jgi:hypothetical protein
LVCRAGKSASNVTLTDKPNPKSMPDEKNNEYIRRPRAARLLSLTVNPVEQTQHSVFRALGA